MSDRGRYDREEIDELKFRIPIADLLGQFGYKVRGGMTLCPFHTEKTPSCKVYTRENRIHCHACGKPGDVFDVLEAVKGYNFEEAAAFLGGRKDLTFEDREHFRKQRATLEAEEKAERQKKTAKAKKLFDSGDEIKGTGAAAYLKNRGLMISKRMWFDLRYIDKLPFWNLPDEENASEYVELGQFPAMLAAIRNPDTRELIGTHRTYLEPGTFTKLQLRGLKRTFNAKKITGQEKGGIIFLSEPADHLLLGEGIETSRSGYELDIGGPDAAVAAGVNIGNIAGGAQSWVPHPKIKDKRIPNGHPNLEEPGLRPPSWAKRVTILGDGDSDLHYTRAMLAVAIRRYREWMIDAAPAMAPAGFDFNDCHLKDIAL